MIIRFLYISHDSNTLRRLKFNSIVIGTLEYSILKAVSLSISVCL